MAEAATSAAPEAPHPSGLSVDERYALLRSVGEECISETELRNLVAKKPDVRCYDGFEPSGRMHIAQGIFKAINVNKCTKAGCSFTFWVADWFALMNDKMGGELERIRIVGEYLVEVWKAAGMDMSNVDFRWSSDDINNHAATYWKRVIDIGRKNTIARMKKCCQIMGRTEGTLSAAQILYPLMQCADIFHLKADICQLGLDQRKVNMLAREYCDSIGRKLKPVILSHHMLAGLTKGMGKMSKSNPDSAIFMEDSAEEVERKIRAAYCPRIAQKGTEYTEEGVMVATDELNPCLDYVRCTAFAVEDGTFTAGCRTFNSYEEVETAFIDGSLSEQDLKTGLIAVINTLLQPVRDHFASDPHARSVLQQVISFRTATGASPAVAAPKEEVPAEVTPKLVAWLPVALHVPLSEAVTIVDQLNAFIASNDGRQALLVLPDWSAYALGLAGGEEKEIQAAIEVHTALFKTLGLNAGVEVRLQSELILEDPNAYWLAVIAAGRKFSLGDIESALGGNAPDAGFVVAGLMRLAECKVLQATSIVATSTVDVELAKLTATFTQGVFQAPTGVADAPFRATLCDPASQPTTADDWLYCDEPELDIKRKLKRAFAAPNDASSTVAQLGCFLIGRNGNLVVSRPADNGGEVSYTAPEQLLNDCKSGALHPGDLKGAVTPAIMKATEAARATLNGAEVKKAITVIKNAEKKNAKGAAKK
jgi:tyrosyl-tRNA synthetase